MTDPVRVDPASPRSGSWRMTARIATAALLAAALAPAWLIGNPSHTIAAEPATYATTSTFELVPDSGLVHVTVTLTIHNNKRNSSQTYTCTQYYYDPSYGWVPYTTTCTQTTSYYINNSALVVDPEGTNFRATTSGGTARVTVKSGGEGFLSNATVSFPRILYGQTRAITVTYDLLGGAPRSDAYTRAGLAYARFCGFLAGAYLGTVDSMRIVVPAAYKVTQYVGDVIAQRRDASTVVLEVPDTIRGENSDLAQSCVEAVDTDSYVGTHLTSASGVKLEINAWPEDAEWLAAVSDAAGAALDDLEEAIGQGPATESVTVEEVARETLRGYGGKADIAEQLVRISETAMDPVIAVHEMAHLWFNGGFSPEVWLTEGYAEYFARLLTSGEPDCEKPAADILAGIDLSDWVYLPRLPTDADRAAVYGEYDTACWVVTEVASRMPPDAIREIYAAALDREIAYLGAGPPETLTFGGPILWRRFLDIVDERVFAYEAGDPDWLQELLQSVGITDSQAELTARSGARVAYHQLLAEAQPWAAPFVVRLLLSDWHFDDAQAAITTATQTAALHRDAIAKVAELGASATVQEAYEGAEDTAALDDARDLAEEELTAAGVVADAVAAADAERGPLEVIGLLGSDLQEEAGAAVEALVDGQFDEATSQGNELIATRAGATTGGALRLGGAGVLILGGSGAVVLYRRRRARRAFDRQILSR